MKKVLFVLPSLRGGGAERVMLTLLRHLNRNIFSLHLALVAKEGPYLNDVPDDIPIYDLGAKRVRYAYSSLLKLIRRLKPDVVFSTLGHLNMVLIMLKCFMPSHTRLIVREANTVSEILKQSSYPRLWKWLYSTLYKRADLIVCQSDYMKQDLIDNYNVPENKTTRIYNPVDIEAVNKFADSGENPFENCSSSPNIVAVGRLEYQKGFDRLLRAMPRLLKEWPHAKLWLLGEGSLEKELKDQCIRLEIAENVEFVGFQKNPYVWLKHADLFVLSSYYEGLPNVLLEAIACDCPICVLHHPGGTREVLERLGLLDRLIEDEIEVYRYVSLRQDNYWQQFKNSFGIEAVVSQYESLFLSRIDKTK